MKKLSDLMATLTEDNKKKAAALIKKLKGEKKKDTDIVRQVHKKFPRLTSFDILGLMESVTGIPVSETIEPYECLFEGEEITDGSLIFILDETRGKKYYIEGTVDFSNLSIIEDKDSGVNEEYNCEICGSDEHIKEDCDKIEESLEENTRIIAEMCNKIRLGLDNSMNNKEVLGFFIEMNRVKAEREDKSFEYLGKTYDIAEQTEIIKNILVDEDKVVKVYGECIGKLYKVENDFETNCNYIKITQYKIV